MPPSMSGTGTLAIDVGGTFTDITFADAATGVSWVAKTPSTPDDLSAGFVTAVRKVLALARRRPADVLRVLHGTTTATNAILEGKTPPTALVTTAGFKYVLEIGRHDIPRHGNLYGWSKPTRPITPDRVFEVTERLDAEGAVLAALDAEGARAVARQLAQLGVPSVAIVFLHAYANPAHEQRMAAILRAEYPGVLVSLSSEVLPQFREFERSMATALNAAVMPPVSRYMGVLRGALDAEGVTAPLLIMKSDGGVTSAATCLRLPVQTVLSGPAAGVVGALGVARAAALGDIISIDVGGTSADICLVRGGRPEITKDGMVGPFPLKLPMLDIHTIGAGGGSIAVASGAGGRLTVGPRSAGAEPGPVCYGRGGTEPTVTDAHLVLARIPPALLGGELPLDLEAARAAIEARVARPLGLSVDEAAAGIVEIIDNSMARAIRAVSVGRGHDPRRFALVAFGGAGPLHACRLAELLGIPTVVVPPRPGVLSTWGLLDTDIRATFVRTVGTVARRALDPALDALETTWRELESQARAWLDGEQVPRDRQRFERAADLRYEHQSFELTCPFGDGPLGAARLGELVATFHREHRRLYTYDLPSAPVELVNLRVTAVGRLPQRAAPTLAARAAGAGEALVARRPVYFRGAGVTTTPCYARGRLVPGMTFEGPAIVEQEDATTLVAPGFRARVDPALDLVLQRT